VTKELKNSKEFVGAIAEEIFGKMGGKVPNLASNRQRKNPFEEINSEGLGKVPRRSLRVAEGIKSGLRS